MPTPNKDNVEKRMEAFQKALSEDDINMLVQMAQESNDENAEEEDKKIR